MDLGVYKVNSLQLPAENFYELQTIVNGTPFILSSGINSGVKNLWYPFFGVMNLNEGLHYCKIKEHPVGVVYDLYRSLTSQLKTRYTSIIHYLSKLVPIIGPIDMKRLSSIYIDNRMNLRPLEEIGENYPWTDEEIVALDYLKDNYTIAVEYRNYSIAKELLFRLHKIEYAQISYDLSPKLWNTNPILLSLKSSLKLQKHTKYRLVFKGCINYNLFNSLLTNSENRLCDTMDKEYIRKNLKDEISKLLEVFERKLDPQFSYTELCRLIRDYNYAESTEFVQQFKQELISLNIDVGLIQTTIDPNILFDRIIQTMSI